MILPMVLLREHLEGTWKVFLLVFFLYESTAVGCLASGEVKTAESGIQSASLRAGIFLCGQDSVICLAPSWLAGPAACSQ